MSLLPHVLWIGLSLAAGPVLASGHRTAAHDVRIEGARLSLHAERLPLRELIAAVERGGLTRIVMHGDVSAMTVSDSFEGLDVAQALRRVLSAHSHLLIDRTSNEQRLIVVILFTPRADAAADTATDPGRPRSDDGEARDPAANRPGEPLLDGALEQQTLVERLAYPDEEVRARALEARKDTGDVIPVEAVEQVADGDVSPGRRIQSLELLAERAEQRARRPLRRALRDSEPAVRARAQELIEDWHLQE